MSKATLHHHRFGVLRMTAEALVPNQWVGWQGTRYGTFITRDGLFVALPLAEVTIGDEQA